MRTPRIYCPGAYAAGEVITLSAEQTHHVARVLRRGPDDPIVVFNGTGRSFEGRVFAIRRGAADIELLGVDADEPLPSTPVRLALAVLKSDTLDYVLQKAAELGAADIQLIDSARAEARHTDPIRRARRMAHWQGIVTGACEQCGRNWLPTLAPPLPFAAWLAGTVGQRWLLDVSGRSTRSAGLQVGEPLTLAIGPEGGWAQDEQLMATSAGFTIVSLGPRTLRADTAPVVALTLAQFLTGNM